MIWRDDDKRDEQQKKLEYARELEQQIELRKALEREQQQQQEEWERRFGVPRDAQSPAKWWTELRASEPSARLSFQMDASALPSYADPSPEQAPASVTSVMMPRQPFHATLGDPLASHDRLREKAQKLEWRRLLDEQMRDKERRLQQEKDERLAREREEAYEEMRLLREQQLRAQRKLGIRDFTPTNAYSPQNYVAIPSPPAPTKPRGHDDGYHGHGDFSELDQATLPPPAPVQARVNDSVDYNFRQAMGLTDAPTAKHYPGRESAADEYRALLVEIRREREELRREREELRREKEEVRMERALLQMENEKMATLLESQRHMTEQRLESIARLDRALGALPQNEEATTPQYPQQARIPRPTRLPSPLPIVHRDHNVQQLKHSMASLAIGSLPQQPSPVHLRRESRMGAMSMADFAPASHLRSPSARAMDALHARRHERFRLQEQDNPLERSLHGESKFVALSPPAGDMRSYDAAPRITETRSPAASMVDPQRERANPLRNSRVIKSRGYYDFNRADAQPVRAQQPEQQPEDFIAGQQSLLSTRGAQAWVFFDSARDLGDDRSIDTSRRTPQSKGSWLGDDHDEDGEDDGHEDEDDGYSDGAEDAAVDSQTDSELSRSLFQVQVLVNE